MTLEELEKMDYIEPRLLAGVIGAENVLREIGGSEETLISELVFTEYAQQLTEDCGLISNINQWPADRLKWDFQSVEILNTTFYYR